MSLATESARTILSLGGFFAGLPLVARRAANLNPAAARALVLEHAAAARRRGGIEITVSGLEHVPQTGPFVLVYNEPSVAKDLSNPEILAQLRVDKVVFAAEYGLIPYFRRAAPRWGVVLLRRHHRDEVERMLAALLAALRAGQRVSMAPEGRIAPDGEVCHFKRGAFLLAIRAGVPVVPMAVRGGREILAPGSWRMRPGVMSYVIGEPLETTGLTERDAPALAASAQCEVRRLFDRRRAATAKLPATG